MLQIAHSPVRMKFSTDGRHLLRLYDILLDQDDPYKDGNEIDSNCPRLLAIHLCGNHNPKIEQIQ